MIAAVWAVALALPLAAPPKLLVNAQLQTASASGGLERAFQPLVAAQVQPGWIGYTVPLVRGYNLGCEYVSPGGRTAPGVVHLEPPDHAVILFRVEAGAVTRIRVLSPDCEIDAGGAPVHWLEDVRPADSTALLENFADMASSTQMKDRREPLRENAIYAISVTADPAGVEFLIATARKDQNQNIRRACISALARSKDPRAVTFLEDLLKH
ncbi:MAG TPA: HEAT repeat domain-containing protein [Bryobacteraceae bacterium]|nr:HEAT repeat domain-containing protein [Bryobacteraceae bacterium]